MKKIVLTIAFVILGTAAAPAQGERFDIATFVPPAGWQKSDAGGSISYMTAPRAGGNASACQIVIYPSGPSKGDARKDFDAAWANIVTAGLRSSAQPTVSTMKAPEGWNMMAGAADITQASSKFATMVTTATDLRRAMSFQVTVMGPGTDCTPAIAAFFNSLKFDVAAAPNRGGTSPGTSRPSADGDYDFTPPAGWSVRRMEGHIRLESPGGSCIILIFPPQASSGDLARDAASVFDNMYRGWQPQKSGSQRYTLSQGFLPDGHEFFVTEAGMSKPSADGTRYDGFEDGLAMVVRAGAGIAMIAARHNASLLGHSNCYGKYEGWRRFFNSFAVRSIAGNAVREDPAKRIIGRWSMTESGASGEYVFAANGNYALVGALGTTSTSSDINYDYLHIKTYAFPGDGSYAIAGNDLTLRRRGGGAEKVTVRFDKVNRGGAGWTDRIHMLKRDAQGLSEVAYEKRGK